MSTKAGGSPSVRRLKENSVSFFREKNETERVDLRNLNRLRMVDMCLLIGIHPSQLQELSEQDYEHYQWYYDQVTKPDSEIFKMHPSLMVLHGQTVTPYHLQALLSSRDKSS